MSKGYGAQFQRNKKTIRALNVSKNGGVYVCEYCNKRNLQTTVESAPDFATIDHFVPLDKGGKHGLYNLRLSCKECNDFKANKHPSIFSILSSIRSNETIDERAEAG